VAGTDTTTCYPNGNIKFTGTYLDGEMHGEWVFYRADGSKLRSGSFDRGRQTGTWRPTTGRIA
jgi:antitoxin component YwqK of YwqJK toxin-antitoxin module